MKSLIFNTNRQYNFQMTKNKFMSLYSPTELRTNEAENWGKFRNSQLQLKSIDVTIKLYHLKH